MVRPRGGFILYARGSSSERPYQFLSDPYNIALNIAPEGLYPRKICTPFSPNSQGSGPNFCFHYTRTPRPVREKIVTVPRPTSRIKNLEISWKIDFFRVTGNRCLPKMLTTCTRFLPITGPKFSPIWWKITFLWNIKKSGGPPIEEVNSQ